MYRDHSHHPKISSHGITILIYITQHLARMSWWIIFSFGWVCWKLRHVEQFYVLFNIITDAHPIN